VKAPVFRKKDSVPQRVNLAPVINSVVSAISDPRFLPLGNTTMAPELMPAKALGRILKGISHRELKSLLSYCPSEGYPELRRQLALRTLGLLEGVGPHDVIITNGCMEALALALLAVTRPGETVAIEAPTNFSFMQLLQELGRMVVEVPTDPISGVDVTELEKMLARDAIRACLFMPNFHNPLGALMPEQSKQALVELTNRHDIPVIEDDISAELYFGDQRPLPLKAFDRKDLVLTCSSFSKTLAPGLRIGWIIPGERFKAAIQRLKAGTTISTSTLDQHVLAEFLAAGSYERHLRILRTALKKQVFQTAMAVQRHLPQDTRFVVPQGGSLLWLELNPAVDGLAIYQRAFDRHIAIIPGIVCANSAHFSNYIQISCAAPVSAKIQAGIAALGTIVSEVTIAG
jgi:DNA-binding transcriptional MocR family regulator